MSRILLALLAGALSRAAPITDSPTERIQPEPGYVPSPRGRGTLDLLFTCVITLVICTWTAIHPDILPKPTLRNRLKAKALYVIIGLFSPEIILAIAFNQLRKARMVLVAWRRCAALEHLEVEVKKAENFLGTDQTNPTGEGGAGPATLQRPAASNVDSSSARQTTPEVPNLESDTLKKAETALTVSRAVIQEGPELERLKEALSNARNRIYGVQVYLRKQGRAGAAPPSPPPGVGEDPESNQTPENSRGKFKQRLFDFRSWLIKPFLRKEEEENELETEFNAVMDAAISAKWAVRRALYRYRALTRNKSTGIRGICQGFTEGVGGWRSSDGEFNMEGAFFAVMGGYRFSPLSAYDHPEYEREISAETLVVLLKTGIITPKQVAQVKYEVKDKGKSNTLVKLLVFGQALWLAINCLLRKGNSLPVTIIEVNVMVHVLIAISVYACWWKKPHDAGTGISLTLRTLDTSICAALYLLEKESQVSFYVTEPSTDALYIARNSLGGQPRDEGITKSEQPSSAVAEIPEPPEWLRTVSDNLGENTSTKDSEKEEISPAEKEGEAVTTQDNLPLVYKGSHPGKLQKIIFPQSVVEEWRRSKRITLKPGRILVDPQEGFGIRTPSSYYSHSEVLSSYMAEDIVITEADLQIFRDAAVAMRNPKYSGIISPVSGYQDKGYNYPIKLEKPHTPKKAGRFLVGEMFWALVPLCLIYGGLHASLWNSYFPTPVERLLWRISSVLIAFPGLVVGAVWGIKEAVKPGSIVRRPRLLARQLLSITGGSLIFAGGAILLLVAVAVPLGAGGGIIYGAMLAHPRIWRLNIKKVARIVIYIDFYAVVAVVVTALLIGAITLFVFLLGPLLNSRRGNEALRSLRYLIATLCVVAYCSARAFIFVESFICLRSLPPGSYQTVPFEDSWPHI